MDYKRANFLLVDKLEDASQDKIDRLYVNLKPKDKDSRKWKDQVQFWSKLIHNWGKETDAIEFSLEELSQSLGYNDLIPQLKPSIDYLVSIGVLKTHEDATSEKSFIGSLSSKLFGLVWSPSEQKHDKYVFVDNLKNKINNIIAEVKSNAVDASDIVLTEKELEDRFRDDEKYPFDLILYQLDHNKNVKKFDNGYYFDVGHFKRYNFTDETISSMLTNKENIKILDEKIDVIEKRIEYDLNCAKSFKKQGRMQEARSSLAHKKMLEKLHDNYSKMRDNLEYALSQFEQNHTITKYVNALKSANEAMKKMDLPSIEEVDSVMDEMQDLNDVHSELVDAMQLPDMENFDEELEKEFENLPTEYENPKPTPTKQQEEVEPNYPEIPQLETPLREQPQETPRARLKTPEQLAQNVPQYF